MSDKSFGDHMSRGIVKNPLLSTAVTGLSIEDLTHNAVLLPVSRSEEPFGRQEPGPTTLAHEITPSPSGDASFTPIHPPTEQNAKKDDFDVNEYFARLQGTRYVSAPINSHIEDSLDKEENLEEINLNEPNEVENIQTPSGITADIAQNFSQLPTVLPQVASAVFSSFSNMLSMKSREHTPDEMKSAQTQVPLVATEREVAPPPREPPVTGPANFRLTTRKKYAQIPGLSSGESAEKPTALTFNQPIFTPQEFNNNYANIETNIPTIDAGQTNVFNNNMQSIPVETRNNQTNLFEASKQEGSNFVATSQFSQETNAQAGIIPPPLMFSNLAKKESLPNVGRTILPPSVARRIGSNKPTINNQAPAFAAIGNIFVPTPVDQSSTNTHQFAPYQTDPTLATSFPTNYASPASQPLPMPIPPTTFSSALPPNATFTSSDIIPSTSLIGSSITMPTNTSAAPAFNAVNLPPPPKTAFGTPSAKTHASITSSTESMAISPPQQLFTPGSHSQSVAPPPMFPGSSMAPNIPAPVKSETRIIPNMPPPTNVPLFTSVPTISTSAPPLFPENPTAAHMPSPTNVPLFTNVPTTSAPVITASPKMCNPYLQDQPNSGLQSEGSIVSSTTPSQISEPNKHVSLLSKNLTDDQFAQLTGIPPVAEPTIIPEPPKASSNTNFRMTKKRPQYYSGPIEGVGAISNNIKPTLTPVAPVAFHGAVFTPEPTGSLAAMFTPENVTEKVSSHGANLTPENIPGDQQQFSMFTPIGVDVKAPANQSIPSESAYPAYNTSFDLSREATDSYEPPKQESAFGIIGSLKSKLSSIDINKLQNSVTTFFDPGYNVKTETADRSQPNYEHNQGIEIFVPSPEPHPQPYNYDAHQNSFTYGQGSIPNASDYYNQQTHNMYSNNSYYTQPSYGTQNYSHTDIPVKQAYNQDSNIYYNPTPAVQTESSQSNVISCESTSTVKDRNDTYTSSGVSQELAASFGITATETESSQANVVSRESTSSGVREESKTGDNFVVKQELTEAFNTVPVSPGKTDDVVAWPQDQLKNNVSVAKNGEKEEENAMKNLQTKYGIIENIHPFQLTEDIIKLNYISSPFANQSGESPECSSTRVGEENKTSDNFVVKQELTEAFLTVPISSGKTDDVVASPQDQLEKNVSVTKNEEKEENLTEAMKNLRIKYGIKENIHPFQLTEEIIKLNYISSPFANQFGEFPGVGAEVTCESSSSSSSVEEENKTGTSFAVKQELAEGYGTVPVSSCKTDDVVASPQDQLEKNISVTKADEKEEENLTEEMKNLRKKYGIKKNIHPFPLTEDIIKLNYISSPYADYFGKFPEALFRDGNDFIDMLDHTEEHEEHMPQHKAQIDNIYSAPLRDLSSMIADRSKEISDGVSEGGVSWDSNEEEVDDRSAAERLMALASDDEDPCLSESGQPHQSTCGTCGKFKRPEQTGNDLTHKLIKNITAPIQLSNPVEVPLTVTDSTAPDDFDTINQCAEISLIADETVETLQIQSATELLKDNTNTETGYGWRTEAPLPPGQDLLDHDYSFKPNPHAIGLLGNNPLFFDNLADYSTEMKPEFTLTQGETPIVLQREMSIPTAPPAEDTDDAKSDETGVLDVQSIEQDASKDFPVFEEYVIEPSEMDDEKIELDDKIDEVKDIGHKNDEVKDTFTNRVDRFKKLEFTEDAAENKDSNVLNSNTMMPSYFDTGNYAAEAHFKNSMISPTIARIPPGFENYKLMSKDLDKKYEPIKVPDTGTQTKQTISITVAHTKTENVTSTVFSNISAFTSGSTRKLEPQHEPKLPNLANVFGAKTEPDNSSTPSIEEPKPQTKLPDFASVFGAKIEPKDTSPFAEKHAEVPSMNPPVNPQAKIENKVQEIQLVTLPDPINFFGSSIQEPVAAEGVNRLASYFSTPPKTENTKSFFELSQGQDHYRQKDDKSKENIGTQSLDKDNMSNTPHDTYTANLNLIKDLTSCQNIEPTKDQIVRTVNFFTVEYDNDDLNFNKGEPSLNFKQPDISNRDEIEKEETINDADVTDILNKCKYCRDVADPVLFCELNKNNVKFRRAMDSVDASSTKEVITEQAREVERSVNVRMEDLASDGDNSEGVAMLTENRTANEYEPVKHHWFYRVDCEDKSTWRGFSNSDSRAIENAFLSPSLNESTLVPTDGGRYDVNVVGRLRIAVYWTDKPTNVRRCSWFYKGTTDARYVPYTEAVAEKLEVEYRHGITTGEWHRRLVLPNNELVVMHGPAVMVHFLQGGTADAFGAPNLFTFGKRVYRNPPKFKVPLDLPPRIDHLLLLVHGAGEWKHQRDKIQSTMRPRVVRRGIDESEIEDTEPSSIDHLLLLCHGVGSACDMRFRAVEEVDRPQWHFYRSKPTSVSQKTTAEKKRRKKFDMDDFRATSLQLLQSHYRNSYDNGIVGRVEVLPISWHASLHSGPKGVDRRLSCVTLASIPRLRAFTNDTVLDVLFYTSPHYCQMILNTVCGELNRIYTLFMSRNPSFKGQVSLGGHSLGSVILYDLLCNQPIPRNPVKVRPDKTYISGTVAHNPTMQYPRLCFEPLALYALGSPIAIFECIRGVESLGSEFYLPTCSNFFNIFHPYDPIAYRIEPLVNPQLQNVKPSLIPHHKGRKRMHLELKDTMARVGADLKQKLIESIRNTWTSMWSSAAPPDHQLEKVVEEEIEKEQLEEETSKEEPIQADVTPGDMLGRLNGGRRVDYVLQEAPFEMINEYLFAMSSHVCYWESEDVMLLILREIYDSMGVQPDVTVPQQSMTVQRTVVPGNEKIVTNAADASTSRVS